MLSGLQAWREGSGAKAVVSGEFLELARDAAARAGHTDITGGPLEICHCDWGPPKRQILNSSH